MTHTNHTPEAVPPAQGADEPGTTSVLDAADGLCYAAFSLLEMKGPLDADDYRDLLRSAWQRYCYARNAHDAPAPAVPQGAAAEPTREEATCARCHRALSAHRVIVDLRGEQHHYCYEFTRETSGEDALTVADIHRYAAAYHRRIQDASTEENFAAEEQRVTARLAALRQSLASAEAREAALAKALAEIAGERGNWITAQWYERVAQKALDAARAALSPSPSEPAR